MKDFFFIIFFPVDILLLSQVIYNLELIFFFMNKNTIWNKSDYSVFH